MSFMTNKIIISYDGVINALRQASSKPPFLIIPVINAFKARVNIIIEPMYLMNRWESTEAVLNQDL